MFMTLDKTSQERLLVFGFMAATETANEGRMHAGRMVQEMKDELSEAERTLLAIKEWTARLIGSLHRPNVPSETPQRPRNRRVSVHDAIKLLDDES